MPLCTAVHDLASNTLRGLASFSGSLSELAILLGDVPTGFLPIQTFQIKGEPHIGLFTTSVMVRSKLVPVVYPMSLDIGHNLKRDLAGKPVMFINLDGITLLPPEQRLRDDYCKYVIDTCHRLPPEAGNALKPVSEFFEDRVLSGY